MRQGLDAFQNICGSSKQIFLCLRCGIGYVGKGSECCNIAKVAVSKAANVHLLYHAGSSNLCGFQRMFGNTQAGSKVIYRARWNIAQRDTVGVLQKTGHNFVECSISACTYNAVKLCSALYDNIGSVQRLLGRVYRNVEPGFYEDIDTAQCGILDGTFSGVRIYDKK